MNWTTQTECWLRDIFDYTAEDNPAAAEKVVSGLYAKAQLLHEFPEIGYSYRKEPDGDIRILLYGHYRIAYLIKTSESIDILGVFHGALDINRLLTSL
ncbi:type II toxin-antitoxin system RelE/ParE family toxin [Methylobacter sp. Wu8]|uniref:type II toxin-antitoxin system RelE/ParE family toxin n=1 Tax=Methylobacter sp. Wu8 TaxID=3118457 RepID=UPI002F2BC0AB